MIALKRFVEQRPQPISREVCELCSEAIPGEHSHIVQLETRRLLCTCRPCYYLFLHGGAKYRAVPERYLRIIEPVFTPEEWEDLQIPVGMAFFFFNSSLGRAVAFYPSPAGATESVLPVSMPLPEGLMPDVEALLVREQGAECYIVPIDACYELVGRIRKQWKGFGGGEEARHEINEFFERIRVRSEAA
jgi:hypothetical protein